MCVFDLRCTNTCPPLPAVPSEPPQNVRAISVTSDEAVITWAEPPRLTLHGVLKGYRVVFWSLFPDGGGCCGGQAQWPMQSNYHLSHSKLHQPSLPPTYLSVGVVSQNVSVCVCTFLIKHYVCFFEAVRVCPCLVVSFVILKNKIFVTTRAFKIRFPFPQNGERCKISPPLGNRWSCEGWRSSPTTVFKCWPTHKLEMGSGATSYTSKPARTVSIHPNKHSMHLIYLFIEVGKVYAV